MITYLGKASKETKGPAGPNVFDNISKGNTNRALFV